MEISISNEGEQNKVVPEKLPNRNRTMDIIDEHKWGDSTSYIQGDQRDKISQNHKKWDDTIKIKKHGGNTKNKVNRTEGDNYDTTSSMDKSIKNS